MEFKDPSEYGLVYGSNNNIMAWHTDLEEPILLAKRNDDDKHGSHVTCLAFNKGKLYDTGHGGIVRETLTGKILGELPEVEDPKAIFGIGFLGKDLIATRHIDPKSQGSYSHARLYYVETGKNIIEISGRHYQKRLSYRSGSLDLKITQNGKIYLASENIIQVIPRKKGRAVIKRLTDYLADFVRLACEGNQVYSLHTYNSGTDPDGTEVRRVPSNKRIAFWIPSQDWGHEEWKHEEKNEKVYQRGYGFADMFAMFGNTLIIGTHNYDNKENNIYAVNLTSKMLNSKDGARATPIPLIRNAYKRAEVYGEGNPIVAVPRKGLEKLLG